MAVLRQSGEPMSCLGMVEHFIGTGTSWNMGFALGGMMPTFVSLVSSGPANIPMSLSIFAAVIFAIYTIGAVIIPETKGNFR